jgi:hypothetical protein
LGLRQEEAAGVCTDRGRSFMSTGFYGLLRRSFSYLFIAYLVGMSAFGLFIAESAAQAVDVLDEPGTQRFIWNIDRDHLWPPNTDDTQIPLDWWNVVILVNANSPAGLEVVKLYREYHPRILDEQIVYLGGLGDSASLSATPSDEIITRADFETHIAEPTRAHLIDHGMVDQTYVIITTAGMPYRIEDTDPSLADVVKTAGSNGGLTVANRHVVNAASVESELAVLFQIDPAAPEGSRMPLEGRMVNPYQGYRTPIKRWANDRSILARRTDFRFTYMWRESLSPKIEGEFDNFGYSAANRRMSPSDLYLVARLDGPRVAGKYPIFAVREMLERAARASDPLHPRFAGYSKSKSCVAIDHSPRPPAPDVFASSDIYNLPVHLDMLTYAGHPVPPGAEEITARKQGNHYFRLFEFLTTFPATPGATGQRFFKQALGGMAVWDDTGLVLSSGVTTPGNGIVGLLTYGRNGGDGRPADYLLTAGPSGGPIFPCVPGAVFTSIESFNAVTMFSDAPGFQAKIVQFIDIGGTAAVGHAFEPDVEAAIHGEYLYGNLLRDDDADGIGDFTLVEAVFTGLPFVSWAEVLIGDPLMRLRSGPGAIVSLVPRPGDVDEDGVVGFDDLFITLEAYGSVLGDSYYNLMADLNEDGAVGDADLQEVVDYYGTVY